MLEHDGLAIGGVFAAHDDGGAGICRTAAQHEECRCNCEYGTYTGFHFHALSDANLIIIHFLCNSLEVMRLPEMTRLVFIKSGLFGRFWGARAAAVGYLQFLAEAAHQ